MALEFESAKESELVMVAEEVLEWGKVLEKEEAGCQWLR